MESPEVEVSTTEIELYDCCKPLEIMSPAAMDHDLTPGRRNLMNKYLSLKENEPWPLLAEYFGVALAFAALGALIRGLKYGSQGSSTEAAESVKLSLKLQRVALQAMLKGAMERLQCLAQNAQDLKQRLKESTDARTEERTAWEIDKTNLLQKIADAKMDVAEMKRRREEDAKANEKVVQIYASQEQNWRSESKKLRHEIDLLRNDLLKKEVSGFFINPRSSTPGAGTRSSARCCEECKAKAKHLKELEETLSEKEFLMMRAIEEAQSEEQERNELAGKLVKAEAIAAELRERIATDDSNKRQQQQAFMAQIAAKQQETERKLEAALEHLEKAKADIVAVTQNRDATIAKLLLDLATLQKDLDDKEEVIRVMLLRASIEREEKEELAREVSQSKALRKQAESEKERWKRLADERGRCTSSSSSSSGSGSSGKQDAAVRPSRRSLGSRTDLDKLVDLRKAHAEELQSMRSLYGRQIEALDSEIEMYKTKILQLEEVVVELQHTDVQEQERKRPERQCPAELAKQLPEPHAESSTPVQRSWRASNFEEPMKDPAFKEWLEVVKGRHTAHLEDRHWHEVQAFERQMRVKDEKIGVFRSQLLAMEAETKKLKSELETLRGQSSTKDKCRSEVTDEKNNQTIFSMNKCVRNLDGDYGPNVVVNTEVSSDVKLEQDMVELLNLEIAGAMKKLEEKDMEHQANLLKMAENAEAELRQKDIQLAVVEAELCQMQKRFEERSSGLKASTGICQEKIIMTKNNHDQESLLEKVQFSSTGGENQTQPNGDSENKAEGLVHPPAATFNSHRLHSADSLLEEEKAMILSPADVATNDILHLQDHNVLSDDKETTGSPLQVVGLEKVGKTNIVPAELSHTVLIEKHPKSLSRLHKKTILAADLQTKGGKSLTKQPSSPFRAADHFPTSRKKMYSPSLVQAPHLQSFKPIRKDLFQSLEKKKLPDKHRPQPNLSKDRQTHLSPRTKSTIIKRKDSQTREEIQLLGLALEVRKIEQQLAMMNKAPATCKTEAHHKPLKAQGRLQTKAVTPRKKTRQYAALAGKVNQLAKQIGLTNESLEATMNSPEEQDPLTTELYLPKNHLFTQEPSSSELILLQQRAEAVSENLAAIQAKFSNESRANIFAKDAAPSICKGPLVDTVRAHLSQVQLALSLKMACNVTVPEGHTYLDKTHQVHAGCFQEDLKGVARFDRQDSKLSNQEAHSQSVIGKQAQAILRRQEPTVELQR